MHLDARQMGRMTLTEAAIVTTGWRRANSPPETPRAPSREEFESADWEF